MRVIGGSARGRKLNTRKGRETRPTADRVKESLFNILAPLLDGSEFLDVFAGNGGIGIEALSRGAARCVFIEKNSLCATIIRDNLEMTGLTGQAELLNMDAQAALALLKKRETQFDLMFFDPPYFTNQLGEALKAAQELLVSGGVGVVEHHSGDFAWNDGSGWTRIREKIYGDTTLSFLVPAATVDQGAPQEQGGA